MWEAITRSDSELVFSLTEFFLGLRVHIFALFQKAKKILCPRISLLKEK